MRLDCTLVLMTVIYTAAASAESAAAEDHTLRGWLSDEQCARARASSGVYTGTNPDCAKNCVGKGTKIVLIDADRKVIVAIGNHSAKQLEKGLAACERPKLQQ